MSNTLTLQLPPSEQAHATSLEMAVRALPGVDDAGTLVTRSIDPVALGVWIQLAAGATGVGASLVGIVTGVVALVRQKSIKGAKIKRGNVVVELGEASASDVEAIVALLERGGRAR